MRPVPPALAVAVALVSVGTAVAEAPPAPTFDLPPVIPVPEGEKVDPDGVVRFKLPPSEAWGFAAGESCPFAYTVTPTFEDLTVKTFRSGVQRVFGRAFYRMTNTENGRHRTVNASGPATYTPRADGGFHLALYGRTLGTGPDGAAYMRRGSWFVEFGPPGTEPVPLSYKINASPENLIDLCAALA
jgi:hypothetical protein